MFGLRPTELLIILAIILVLFGAKKLPGLARSLGSSAQEFKKGLEGGGDAASDEEDPA
jgi:sec-independent protein translocase protein TatA